MVCTFDLIFRTKCIPSATLSTIHQPIFMRTTHIHQQLMLNQTSSGLHKKCRQRSFSQHHRHQLYLPKIEYYLHLRLPRGFKLVFSILLKQMQSHMTGSRLTIAPSPRKLLIAFGVIFLELNLSVRWGMLMSSYLNIFSGSFQQKLVRQECFPK